MYTMPLKSLIDEFFLTVSSHLHTHTRSPVLLYMVLIIAVRPIF
jgi:hypothetical protein